MSPTARSLCTSPALIASAAPALAGRTEPLEPIIAESALGRVAFMGARGPDRPEATCR